jgi:SpoVK/Ycf46/Vps4 family AAA+-type ATPase
MSSNTNKNFIETAKLGLRGDRNALFNFLQELAVSEINKNHHEMYNSLMKLLRDEGLLYPTTSNAVSEIGDRHERSAHIDVSNIWLTPLLQKRIGKILEYLKKTNGGANKNLKRILLYGPPGTGKTTLGFYIAKELELPIRYVKVTEMLSSRLGETMKNIADVFQTQGKEVIFIDEFDAFAKTRVDSNDVGELKRIVNSMIQTLDFVSSEKVIIVATNIVDSIDSALLRRFPFKINVGILNEKEKRDFFTHLLKHNGNKINEVTQKEFDFLFDVMDLLGLNTIDQLKNIVEKAEVEMTLGDRERMTYDDFIEVLFTDGYLSELKSIKKKDEKVLAFLLQEIEKLGYPKTQISSTLGIHRNTYPKYAQSSKVK